MDIDPNWHRAMAALHAMQQAVTQARGQLDATMQAVVAIAAGGFEGATGAAIEYLEGDRLVCRWASGGAERAIGHHLAVEGTLCGVCIRTGIPQICHDSEIDPRVHRETCRRSGSRSIIIVPLPMDGKVVGALMITSDRPNAFAERDVAAAQLLIAPAAYGLAAASAERSRQMLEATFDQAAVGIAHVSAEGRFLRVNARFSAISSYTAAELLAGGFQQITYPEDLEADLEQFDALSRGDIPAYALEKRYVRRDGSLVWINLTVSLVRTVAGAPDFFVAVIEDISARKDAERLALFDPLTGLPNRRQLLARLDEMLEPRGAHDGAHCVAFVDIDRFKGVNDRFGHQEGDRCLAEVAACLRENVRGTDVVGRYAGDEFVLLMSDCAEAEAAQLTERLRETVAKCAARNRWDIGISVGAVLVDGPLGYDRDRVLDAADRLMYRVKHGGTAAVAIERYHGGRARRRLRRMSDRAAVPQSAG